VNNKGEKASKGRKGKYRRKVEEFTKENAIASLWPAKVFIVTENEKCTSHLLFYYKDTISIAGHLGVGELEAM
jgi:hypothetical protein